ncbi:hypothetical protein ACGRHY_19810 [Streptomyces sp. HK10]
MTLVTSGSAGAGSLLMTRRPLAGFEPVGAGVCGQRKSAPGALALPGE